MKLSKRLVVAFICMDVLLVLLASPMKYTSEICFNQIAAHTPATQYGWYYMPRTDGQQPSLAPEFSFIRGYDTLSIGNSETKVIYITFDAGYENGYATAVLDTLKAHNATAAFFLVGHYFKSNPDIVQRMAEEGHLICSHSMNHKNMASMADFEEFRAELTSLDALCEEVTGQPIARFFRPPEGSFSERLLEYSQRCGYTTVFWSFAYKDWYNDNQPSAESAFDTIISRTHPGEIALLHLTSRTNAEVLDSVLTEWENMGYTFGSLKELAPESGPDV